MPPVMSRPVHYCAAPVNKGLRSELGHVGLLRSDIGDKSLRGDGRRLLAVLGSQKPRHLTLNGASARVRPVSARAGAFSVVWASNARDQWTAQTVPKTESTRCSVW